MIRSAASSVRIRHSAPDVARLLLINFENAENVTLYCWHSSLQEFFSPDLKSLTLISAYPMHHLPGLPRELEELHVRHNVFSVGLFFRLFHVTCRFTILLLRTIVLWSRLADLEEPCRNLKFWN